MTWMNLEGNYFGMTFEYYFEMTFEYYFEMSFEVLMLSHITSD